MYLAKGDCYGWESWKVRAGAGQRIRGSMKMQTFRLTSADDETVEKLYERLMKEASNAGLIVSAYGGVATVAIPREQRKVPGLRRQCLEAACLNESPGHPEPMLKAES